MKIKKTIFIALGLAILIGVAGCNPRYTGLNDTNNKLSTQTRLNPNTTWDNNARDGTGMNDNIGMNDNLNNNMNDGMYGMNDLVNGTTNQNLNNGMLRNNNMTTSMGNLNTNASDLARKIGALPEVDSASVVLTNDKALVGVDLKGNTNTTTVSTALRQKIEKMVKDSSDIKATDVSITTDPNLLTRIQTLSKGMTNTVGNDMSTFTKDIEQLIRDIVPGGRNTNTNIINR